MAAASDPIEEFTTLARQFVSVVEDATADAEPGAVGLLAELIARLYAAGMRLPDVEPSDAADPASLITDVHGETVRRRLGDLFGGERRQDYDFVVSEDNEDSRGGWLTDDLYDIWGDLKDGLLLLDAGVNEKDVIWEWRFSFWTHWGAHAVGALHLMHVLYGDGTMEGMEYKV